MIHNYKKLDNFFNTIYEQMKSKSPFLDALQKKKLDKNQSSAAGPPVHLLARSSVIVKSYICKKKVQKTIFDDFLKESKQFNNKLF